MQLTANAGGEWVRGVLRSVAKDNGGNTGVESQQALSRTRQMGERRRGMAG